MIESGATETGVLVDEVGEVADVPVSQFEAPLSTLEAGATGFVEHTCRWNNRLIAVVRAEKFLVQNDAHTLEA